MKSATVILIGALTFVGCASTTKAPTPPAPQPLAHAVIPNPVSLEVTAADTFTLTARTAIVARGGADAERVARFLASLIGNTKETTPRVLTEPDTSTSVIELNLVANAAANPEAYELLVTRAKATITASNGAGLFYGVQTFRQLLPYSIEYTAALYRPMKVVGVHITDAPRYEWRGAMLDVVRHFRTIADVESYIDLLAMYKLNRLHLVLSNDQGWRIDVPTWPNLALIGGSTQVGGGPGGYYTQQQYQELQRYASERYVTIVPEIDMPGHVNAAMASYPELNCDGVAPPLYTGTSVGFSALCVDKEITNRFVDDVIASISAVTTGPWFHAGGDEVRKIGREKYNAFFERVEQTILRNGKKMIGWSEVAPANISGTTLIQSWQPDSAQIATARGSKVILSPASRIYLDMQYDSTTPIGLHWSGFTDLSKAYNWEPADFNPRLDPSAVLGLEAPLWAETIGTMADVYYLALPRLTAAAELSWSRPDRRDWSLYSRRILEHEKRWTALGLNYRRLNPN